MYEYGMHRVGITFYVDKGLFINANDCYLVSREVHGEEEEEEEDSGDATPLLEEEKGEEEEEEEEEEEDEEEDSGEERANKRQKLLSNTKSSFVYDCTFSSLFPQNFQIFARLWCGKTITLCV